MGCRACCVRFGVPFKRGSTRPDLRVFMNKDSAGS